MIIILSLSIFSIPLIRGLEMTKDEISEKKLEIGRELIS
jgi:hypothetical protein